MDQNDENNNQIGLRHMNTLEKNSKKKTDKY